MIFNLLIVHTISSQNMRPLVMKFIIFFVIFICFNPSEQQNKEFKVLNELRFVESDLIDVDFGKFLVNWTLRASTARDVHRICSHSISHMKGNEAYLENFYGRQQLGTNHLSHIKGSKAVKAVYNMFGTPVQSQPRVSVMFYLHLDETYKIVYSIDAENNYSYLKVWVANGIQFNGQYVMEIIINQLMEKVNVKRLIGDVVPKLEFLNQDLTDFFPRPLRTFAENETASIDQLSGIYDLRYATDDQRNYNYMIAFQENNQLKSIRMVRARLISNLTEYRIPNSNKIFRFYTNVNRSSNEPISKLSWVEYLHVDNNYVVSYETSITDVSLENIKFYIKQNYIGNLEEYRNIFIKILLTTGDKLKDMMLRMKTQYMSPEIRFPSNKTMLGEWTHLGQWPKFNIEYVRSIISLKDKLFAVKKLDRYNREIEDELFTPINGTNSYTYISLKTGATGQVSFAYTDYVSRAVLVFKGNFGFDVQVIGRKESLKINVQYVSKRTRQTKEHKFVIHSKA